MGPPSTAGRIGRVALPAPIEITHATIPDRSTFLGATGFEDRALSTLEWLAQQSKKLNRAFLISYNPASGPNRVAEMARMARAVTQSTIDPYSFEFKRFSSSSYLALETLWRKVEKSGGDVIVDISGMSKFLILGILWAARRTPRRVIITYFRPAVYHPTETEFKASSESPSGQFEPFILRGGAPYVLTSPWLSSARSTEQPVFLIAFPNFDSELITEAIDELTPESILLLGPGTDSEPWWRDAIKEVNRNVYQSSSFLNKEFDATMIHDYRPTVYRLLDAYEAKGLTHRVVIAPTGSKMQAVGTFLFKVIRADAEIIYPAPVGHNPLSTEGVGLGATVDLGPSFGDALESLRQIRREEMSDVSMRFRQRATALASVGRHASNQDSD